jgi:predicted phage terminase large subunit-like protein
LKTVLETKNRMNCGTISKFSEEQRKTLLWHFDRYILHNQFIPLGKTLTCQAPSMKQAEFLMHPAREILYGGSVGGGKTIAMLMAALMYVEVPGYSALILRKSYNDLSQPGCPIPISQEWLRGSGATYSATKFMWTFPSGATLSFGYLQNEFDKFRYQGSVYQFIGFDELTQHTESSYLYLFSRLRRPETLPIQLRMRATSNPGGVGHEWVKMRFLDSPGEERIFIPAGLKDNPFLDAKSYTENLSNLDSVTRRQLLDGDWSARASGGKFKREWFTYVDDFPRGSRVVRFWDLAGTKPARGKDPDWTAGVAMTEKDGIYYILDVQRMRGSPQEVEALIKSTAEMDLSRYANLETCMEREPGSSGVNVVDHYARNVLKGVTFYAVKSTGDKELRANPMSSAAEAGNIRIVRGKWILPYLDELEAFPESAHDDQVDASSGAFTRLSRPKGFIIY